MTYSESQYYLQNHNSSIKYNLVRIYLNLVKKITSLKNFRIRNVGERREATDSCSKLIITLNIMFWSAVVCFNV
jgi:hypothetical protein